MKKLFAALIIGLSACLTACSFSTKTTEVKNEISVDDVTFNYTYSHITFDFKKDPNAKYYYAFFEQDGKSRGTLTNVLPKVEYDFPSLPDGNYSVVFKGFGNPGYTDSMAKNIGTVHKFLSVKDVNDLSLSTEVTDEYSIKINIKNKDTSDKTPVTVSVKNGLTVIQKFEHLVGDQMVETEKDLPAGEYKIAAFFEKTEDSKQTHEIFSDPVNIPTRQLIISDFSVKLEGGNFVFNWKENGVSNKKLTVNTQNNSETYINKVKGIALKDGCEIPLNTFGEGNISFTLQLVPLNGDETYLESECVNSEVFNITFVTLPTINFTANYSKLNGNVTINLTKEYSGKIKVVVKGTSSGNKVVEDIYNAKDFPLVFKKANIMWGTENYEIALTNVSTSPLETDSQSVSKSVTVSKVILNPNASFKKEGERILVSYTVPESISNFCSPEEFKVIGKLYKKGNSTSILEKELSPKYFSDFGLDELSSAGTYYVKVSISEETQSLLGKTGFIYQDESSDLEGISIEKEEPKKLFDNFTYKGKKVDSHRPNEMIYTFEFVTYVAKLNCSIVVKTKGYEDNGVSPLGQSYSIYDKPYWEGEKVTDDSTGKFTITVYVSNKSPSAFIEGYKIVFLVAYFTATDSEGNSQESVIANVPVPTSNNSAK